MPTIPDVALQVRQALENPDCELPRVAEMIACDPMLSGKVIRIANSPMFGGHELSSVQGAILRVGMKETRRIISTVSIMESITELPDPLSASDFWMLGLGTALCGRTLAQELDLGERDEVYLAGLVHAMGEGLLALNFPERFARAMHASEESGTRLCVELSQEFEATPCAVCAQLLRNWNFPDPIVEAIEYQHDPENAPNFPELALSVFTAQRLCQTMGIAPGRIRELDESWLDEIPAAVIDRVTHIGYDDMQQYLFAHLGDMIEIRDLVNQTFSH